MQAGRLPPPEPELPDPELPEPLMHGFADVGAWPPVHAATSLAFVGAGGRLLFEELPEESHGFESLGFSPLSHVGNFE